MTIPRELYLKDGLTVITDIFFPNQGYTIVTIRSSEGVTVKKLIYNGVNAVYGK